MEWFHGEEAIRPPGPGAVALGAFDGVHRGHQAVLAAAAAAGPAGAVTFDRPPSGAPELLTPQDKRDLLAQAGLGWVASFPFEAVRDLPPEVFFQRILMGRCRGTAFFCGEDFRFGKGAAGDVPLLRELCSQAGVALTVVPPVTAGGEKISSTRIREAVAAGDLPAANDLLGRPFGYALEVIHGNHIGTGLGVPTVNQALPEGLLLPPFGAYASAVEIEGVWVGGVTNIGVKPTVGSKRVLSETWMPGFQGDLYGRRLRLALLGFLRPERKFASLAELKQEIERNAAQAQALVEKEKMPPGLGKILYKPGKLC